MPGAVGGRRSGYGIGVSSPPPETVSPELDRRPPTYWMEDSVTRREIWLLGLDLNLAAEGATTEGQDEEAFPPPRGRWLLRLDLNQQPSG